MEKKEIEKLSLFYKKFKENLSNKNYDISKPVFHDYHFISKVIDKLNSIEITIKIFYKPSEDIYRLIINNPSEKSHIKKQEIDTENNQEDLKSNIIDIFNFTKNQFNNKNINFDSSLYKNNYCVYIDGSYNEKTKKAGWAFCIVRDNQIIYKESGVIDIESSSRQVIAEIYALYKSMVYIKDMKISDIYLFYDYKGIEAWINGTWKVKDKNISQIVGNIKIILYEQKINIKFIKVDAHSGDYFNEVVDKLAKESTKS